MSPRPFRSLLALALLGAALSASAQNIVQDGDFEQAVGDLGTLTTYLAGESFDGGLWTVRGAPSGDFAFMDVDKDEDYVIAGTASLYFAGSTVEQTLATVAGRSYTISFDAYGANDLAEFRVGFGGTTRAFTVPEAQTGPPNPVTPFSFTAVATGSSTLLSFGLTSDWVMELDNVSVQAVPEPASMAALGLGALGLLRRRKA